MRQRSTNVTRILSIILSLLMVVSVINLPTLKASAEGGVDGFVERCYTVTLDRGSDPDGFADWKGQLLNGKSVGVNIAYGFLFSKEYTNKNKSDDAYVKDLYKLFMDREPDQAGFNDWVGKLKEGKSRQEVFAGFANSQEFYNICESYGITAGYFAVGYDRNQVNNVNLFVERLYQTCLGRRGDRGGQKDWVSKLLKKEITGIECARCFIQSKEYVNKNLNDKDYVENMYQAMMGRASDEGGKNNWLYGLKNGMTRDEVFAGFANSKEFEEICKKYGISKGSYTAKDKGTFDKDNPNNVPADSPENNNNNSHTHAYNQKNTDSKFLKSAATCTKAAEYYYSCSCGTTDKKSSFTSGNPLGHDWDNGTVTKAETLTTQGSKTCKCKRSGCNETQTVAIPAKLANAKEGDIIKYGKYEQDGNTSNGKEDIEWKVLKNEGNRVLVISEYVLDCLPYNTTNESVTWQTCSLRKWLNNDFYDSAFSDSEKNCINCVNLENKSNSLSNVSGGNNTLDSVFILSVDEIETYFGGYENYNDEYMIGFNTKIYCLPTQYAIDHNIYPYTINENVYNSFFKGIGCPSDLIDKTLVNWWIRTPGSSASKACYADAGYLFGYSTAANVEYNEEFGVRPAMYIKYESEKGSPQNHTHSFDNGTITKDPTLIETGVKTHYCKDSACCKITTETVPVQSLKDAKVGDYVKIGKYEQDNVTTNGMEDIEWEVLSKEGDKALLISRYVLDAQKYNSTITTVTWETCSLRTWLNDTFFNTAFSSVEQNKIPSVTVKTQQHPIFASYANAPYGNATSDRVFCMSIEELVKYYGDFDGYDEYNWGYKQAFLCTPTAYARDKRGVAKYVITQDDYDSFLKGINYPSSVVGTEHALYWLRNPGQSYSMAVFVDGGGGAYQYSSVDRNYGVRPAIYVNY